jgi:hypothetical protein
MNEEQGRSGTRGGILGWFIAHPKTTVFISLLLLLVIGLSLFDAVAERRLRRQLDAIRAAGEPTTIQDLNEAAPEIPDDENLALCVFEHVDQTMESCVPDVDGALLPLVGTAYSPSSTGQHLTEAQLAASRQYLDGISEPLSEIHEAMKLERGCVRGVWATPAVCSVGTAGYSDYRHVAKVLALEATVTAEEGGGERAAEIILEVLHFERVLDCQGTLIAALVQFAMNSLAQDCIERTINLSGLDDGALSTLQARLHEIEDEPDLKEVLLSERVIFIDTFEWARSTGGLGACGVPSVLCSLWRYVPAVPDLDEADGLAVMTAVVDAVDGPSGESIRRVRKAEADSATLAWYCLMSRSNFGTFSGCVELWVEKVGLNRAIQAAIACERYRLASGDWPKSLEALVPRYLECVPVDPFDGKPIRYARVDEGIKVWCIGIDMKDDGGDIGRFKQKSRSVRSADRGWLLLNPDLRGMPADEEPK